MTRCATLSRGYFTQTDPTPYGAGSAFESAYVYAGNNPVMYTDPTGLRKQNSGWGWAGSVLGGVKDGLGAVAKTPGALYDATVAFPSNVRKLPAGIAAACNEYRGSNGGVWGGAQCVSGVIATGTGIDALTNAMIDCINYTVPGMSAAEYQCMTRHGISATTQAFVTAKAVEVAPKVARELVNRYNEVGTSEVGALRIARSRLTNSQATDLAEYLGYRYTGRTLRGERVFTDGSTYIVQDTTSHIGGTWKIARTADALNSKATRIATTDEMLNPIGD